MLLILCFHVSNFVDLETIHIEFKCIILMQILLTLFNDIKYEISKVDLISP